MELYEQEAYKDLEAAILKHWERKSNLMVVTLPGLGSSYFLKGFVKRHEEIRAAYITGAEQELAALNVIDIDGQKSLEAADGYFQKADLEQKFVLVISRPELLKAQSYALSHIYENYYFRARRREDNDQFVLEINPELKPKELERIYELGGGVAKISKYLAIHPNKLEMDLSDLMEEEELKRLLTELTEAVSEADEELLQKTGLKEDGEWKGELLKSWPWQAATKFSIEIGFDLSFKENGDQSLERLTKEEKDILEFMLANQGQIEREKVSDIKWGEGKYDDFSDQALNKTMRRLSDKLKHYEIETIPKVGYKIKTR